MHKTKRPLSFVLAVLMIVSMFAAAPFTASAEDKVIGEGVIFKQGDTIVLPGSGDYYVKADKYGGARPVSGNGTITRFEAEDEYSYMLEIDGWYIHTDFVIFDYWEEMEQGLSVLGITFTGSGTQSDPYLLQLAFGEVESTWAGEGEGTEASPWLIKDLNDLRTLSANVASGMTYSGKYFKLTADIDCGSDNWEAIGGANAKMFRGTFDGDGKTITYSIVSSENDAPNGLFAQIGSAGTVKNLNVAGSIVNTAEYAGPAGGIAVYNYGLIENCYSAVDITTGSDRGIGGIAAHNDEGATIRYCAASGTLTWTGGADYYAYVGGITGENYNYDVVSMTNCAMLGDVLAQNSDGSNYVGRLIGRQYDASSALDCYYLDTMTVTGVVNSDSVTAKTADELKEIGQAAIDAGYTVYGLALGGSLSNPDQEAADAVIALIDAIGTAEYTDASKEKIDAARAAYDALTDDQKALVTNVDALTTAETSYAEQKAAADLAQAKTDAKAELAAYKNADDYRDAQKTELAEAITAGKTAIDAAADTDAVAAALANAKAAINAIKTDADLTAEELAEEAQDWQSVTIADQIEINFLLDASAHANMQSVTITYTNQAKEVENTVYVDPTELASEGGFYKVPAVVAPAQIGDTITVTVEEMNGETEYNTSIADYCKYLLSGNFAPTVKALAAATLEYGQAANDYFFGTHYYHESDITTITNAVNAAKIDEAKTLANHMSVTTGGKIASISFMALTKPEFRFYVKADCGLTEADFVELNDKITVNGSASAKFVKNGDAILLEVTGIEAANMDEVITITIDGFGTITFCGNDFANLLAKNTSTQTLGTALYLYGAAAKACFDA